MKEIFRKSALENAAAPEQLNQQIRIIRPHLWLFFLIFLTAFVSLFVWVIFGNVTDTTSLEGIVFPQLGVEKVSAQTDGTVKDIIYKAGDEVVAGDIIAVVSNKVLLAELEQCRQELDRASGETEKSSITMRLSELQNRYEQTSLIRASKDGTIQSIAAINEQVAAGSEVASILINNQSSNNRQVVGYIPLLSANQLQVGMEAQICPGYASREEYGYMKGYISYIGTMPVTNESLQQYYGNLEYSKDILPDVSCVELHISLYVDETSKNLFKWSNEKGKELTVDIGTICNIQIVTQSRKPYELVFQ